MTDWCGKRFEVGLFLLLVFLLLLWTLREPFFSGADPAVKVTNFHTDWCGYSRKLLPTWRDLERHFQGDSRVSVADVRCDLEENAERCRGVRGFPTVVGQNRNGVLVEYRGDRSFESLKGFVESLL